MIQAAVEEESYAIGIIAMLAAVMFATRNVDWSSAEVRARYTARVDAWRTRTEELLRAARVDRMDVAVPLTRSQAMVPGTMNDG